MVKKFGVFFMPRSVVLLTRYVLTNVCDSHVLEECNIDASRCAHVTNSYLVCFHDYSLTSVFQLLYTFCHSLERIIRV